MEFVFREQRFELADAWKRPDLKDAGARGYLKLVRVSAGWPTLLHSSALLLQGWETQTGAIIGWKGAGAARRRGSPEGRCV